MYSLDVRLLYAHISWKSVESWVDIYIYIYIKYERTKRYICLMRKLMEFTKCRAYKNDDVLFHYVRTCPKEENPNKNNQTQ